jgi:hypothetical protein
MKFCASSARTVLLVGLLLAVAAAWCAPVVQGRLLQHRDDQEDGGGQQATMQLERLSQHSVELFARVGYWLALQSLAGQLQHMQWHKLLTDFAARRVV